MPPYTFREPLIGPVVMRCAALSVPFVPLVGRFGRTSANAIHSLRRHYPVRFMRSAAPDIWSSRPLSPLLVRAPAVSLSVAEASGATRPCQPRFTPMTAHRIRAALVTSGSANRRQE
ncbi:hypothetical protein GCM10025787_40490 [Saccharopolyspora rosea]